MCEFSSVHAIVPLGNAWWNTTVCLCTYQAICLVIFAAWSASHTTIILYGIMLYIQCMYACLNMPNVWNVILIMHVPDQWSNKPGCRLICYQHPIYLSSHTHVHAHAHAHAHLHTRTQAHTHTLVHTHTHTLADTHTYARARSDGLSVDTIHVFLPLITSCHWHVYLILQNKT